MSDTHYLVKHAGRVYRIEAVGTFAEGYTTRIYLLEQWPRNHNEAAFGGACIYDSRDAGDSTLRPSIPLACAHGENVLGRLGPG